MRQTSDIEEQTHQRAANNEERYWNEMARAALLQQDYWKLKIQKARIEAEKSQEGKTR